MDWMTVAALAYMNKTANEIRYFTEEVELEQTEFVRS